MKKLISGADFLEDKVKKVVVFRPKEIQMSLKTNDSAQSKMFKINFSQGHGFTINNTPFILKSMGFSVVGGVNKQDPTSPRLTKEDIGKSARNVLNYINRADSVTDTIKDENMSLVYDAEKQLSNEDLKTVMSDFKANGVGGINHIVISTGQNLDRDDMILLTRNIMTKYKESTGSSLNYHFAYHTDKGINPDTGNIEKDHIHLLLSGKKSEVKLTPVQLQSLKIIAVTETISFLEKNNLMNDDSLINTKKAQEAHLINLKIQENLLNALSKERAYILKEEQISNKLSFNEFAKDEFKKEDILVYKEIQKIKGNITYIERQNASEIHKKEVSHLEVKIAELSIKLTQTKIDSYTQLSQNNLFSDYKTASTFLEKAQSENNIINIQKGQSWVKNLDKTLTLEQKILFDSISNEDYKLLKSKEFFESKLTTLSNKNPEDLKAEKINVMTNTLNTLNEKLSPDFESKFIEKIDSFKESSMSREIKKDYTEKRLSEAAYIGKLIELKTNFKDYESKLFNSEINIHKDIKFSVDSAIDSLLKTQEDLKKDFNAVRLEADNTVSDTIKKELSEVQNFKRFSNPSHLDYETLAQSLSSSVATQRNKLKSEGGEESNEFRSLQKSFMNLKLIEKDGLKLEDLEKWKEKAVAKDSVSVEDADQFIKNNILHCEQLKEAGILKSDFTFVDSRAKEILFEFHDKDISSLSKINLEDYKMQKAISDKSISDTALKELFTNFNQTFNEKKEKENEATKQPYKNKGGMK